ncbi:hypothetical protein [Stenotrophomonas sp.]|uniref:hypothetical protein n=1 Tax=Stenotrophomonas sp. TaxID=69392 RepID=UPI00289C7259|nr:hypothetical protein [Stenotrophomonas sp.]
MKIKVHLRWLPRSVVTSKIRPCRAMETQQHLWQPRWLTPATPVAAAAAKASHILSTMPLPADGAAGGLHKEREPQASRRHQAPAIVAQSTPATCRSQAQRALAARLTGQIQPRGVNY